MAFLRPIKHVFTALVVISELERINNTETINIFILVMSQIHIV